MIPQGHFWTADDVAWLKDGEGIPSYPTIPSISEQAP
jgi:hypothetical protein